jgi:hypothetical protein
MIQFLNSEIETTTTKREREEPSVELQQIQALKDTVHEEQQLTDELYEESGRFEALYLQLRNLVDRLQVAPNNSREEDMILQTINEKRREIREVKSRMDKNYRALRLVKAPEGEVNPNGAEVPLLYSPAHAGAIH